MLGLLSLSAAFAGEVTFSNANGKAGKVTVVTSTITTGDEFGVVSENLCLAPCTVEMPAGLYSIRMEQSGLLPYEVMLDIGEGGGTVKFPTTRQSAPTLGMLLCCFPIGLLMLVDRAGQPVRVSGDIEIASY